MGRLRSVSRYQAKRGPYMHVLCPNRSWAVSRLPPSYLKGIGLTAKDRDSDSTKRLCRSNWQRIKRSESIVSQSARLPYRQSSTILTSHESKVPTSSANYLPGLQSRAQHETWLRNNSYRQSNRTLLFYQHARISTKRPSQCTNCRTSSH